MFALAGVVLVLSVVLAVRLRTLRRCDTRDLLWMRQCWALGPHAQHVWDDEEWLECFAYCRE